MPEVQKISRHETALRRASLSRPIRLAMESGLLSENLSLLDYGCGHGDDLSRLTKLGVPCWGWDPVHRPDGPLRSADIVNLGYVVNVIEDPEERREALQEAWKHTNALLIVSARLSIELGIDGYKEFNDGCVTKRNTFQKFFTQKELRAWIDSVLGVCSVPASPGVLFVFKSEGLRQKYLLSRFGHGGQVSPLRQSDALYEEHKELLTKLSTFVNTRGRVPELGEIQEVEEILNTLGSVKRAFGILRRVMGSEFWEKVRRERKDDLLVVFAMERFRNRPRFTALPKSIQQDVRAFFGTYNRACEAADALLFAAGNMKNVDAACQEARCGKLTSDALYVHRSGLSSLPPLLRVYEGCARAYIGELEGTNVVKLYRRAAKVSYLAYPEFDTVAHPRLLGSLLISLKELDINYRQYRESKNPPILHRKELFVPEDYPGRETFARLTRQEEKLGLYEETRRIGFLQGWEDVLASKGKRIQGHRLFRAKKP